MSFGGWLLATGLPAAVLIPVLVAPFSVWVVMALTAHLGPGGGLPQLFMMFGYLSLALPGAFLIVFGGCAVVRCTARTGVRVRHLAEYFALVLPAMAALD